MKRKLRDHKSYAPISSDKAKFDKWLIEKQLELGLNLNFDIEDLTIKQFKIEIFGSENNYNLAELEAMQYLNYGKEVPEPLRSKLIKLKKLKEQYRKME